VADEFDFENPDYPSIFRRRVERLAKIRAEPKFLPSLKSYYRDNPAQFISDWGTTSDPRNIEIGRPVVVPFILFPKQREWVDWLMKNWQGRQDGITEKSRDMGISWLAMSLSVTLCLFNRDMAIGFGSRTEDDVDKSGDPASLFWKGRQFLQSLPREFRGGYDRKRTTSHMLISIPETNSVIKGDAGDEVGRGDRTSLYFVDEASHLARPELVDSALSQTTNCRQDVSTPRGTGNPFAQKRFSGRLPVFTFHWRDDPRKDDAWYAKQVDRLDPVTLAQEVDLDYNASVEGVLIPSVWVQAAVDAHVKLGIAPSGERYGAFDVADEGKDMNAFCGAHGIVLEYLEEWSGKGDDIYGSVQHAFGLCDDLRYKRFKYDADGLGAGVRGDARVINESRSGSDISVDAFRGSGEVLNPDGEDVESRKNKDFFTNFKSQSWWSLRVRFQKTYRWVKSGVPCDPDEIISIPSGLPHRAKLCMELSQPTYSKNGAGKILINKAPDGTRSPNLADTVMIRFSKDSQRAMIMTSEHVAAFSAAFAKTRRR
jgi:hypothetical protein